MEQAKAANVVRPRARPLSEEKAAVHPDAARVERAATWTPVAAILIAGGLLIPLVVSVGGEDPFRFPKDLALRAEVILLSAALVLGWIYGRLEPLRAALRGRWLLLTALLCAWTVVCALASATRPVSVAPAIRVLEFALLFVVTVVSMRALPPWIAGVIVPPAVINAAVYILQELELWTPFDTSMAPEKHLTRTALMGNPNYVGSYLVAPAVVALALALTQRRGRVAWAAAAAFLTIATFMTHTVGAILPLIVAFPVMVALHLRSVRMIVIGAVAALIAAAAAFVAYPPLHHRVDVMRDALKQRDFEKLSAARAMPFLSAAEMVRDHPLTGVGPGGFAYNYFDYKLRIQERHRSMFGFSGAAPENFGEVHNDHLQIASETGLPGYALFVAALVLLASASWQKTATPALTRVLALPLAVSFAVLALSQFPLELVAATHAYLWAAAAVVAQRTS